MKKLGIILLLSGIALRAQEQTDPVLDATAKALAVQLQNVNDLSVKLAGLQKLYNQTHPNVISAKAQLEQAEKQVNQLKAQLAEQKYSTAGSSRVSARIAKAKTLSEPSLDGLDTGRPDRWWSNPATAQAIGLNMDQQKKMDDIFQQYRLRLVDLNASLEKEELTLEPLVSAQPLDEGKITAQIDRVAQARAELEKANGRMLLGIRKILTPDQWNALQSETMPKVKVRTRTAIKPSVSAAPTAPAVPK